MLYQMGPSLVFSPSIMIDQIDAAQLKEKLESGEDIVLMDCREQEEWENGHIQQAILVPLSNLDDRVQELESAGTIHKQKLIAIHCRSGKRSAMACQLLADRGYQHLFNIEGGILDWIEEGFPIE